MKRKLLAITGCILAACMLVSCSSGSGAPRPSDIQAPADTVIQSQGTFTHGTAPEGMTFITQKGHVAMYADMATGLFAVEDMRDGTLWYSNPPDRELDEVAAGAIKNQLYSHLIVQDVLPETKTVKTKNTYVSSQKKDGVTVTKLDDGIRVLFRFVDEGYEIPVTYTLYEDSVRAEVDTAQIKEEGEARILSISILPMMGAQGQDAEGYLLMAGGSGSLIHFNNGHVANTSTYHVKVYGDDLSYSQIQRQNFQENYSLPVFGIRSGDRGLLAVADAGAAEAYVNASVNGLLTSYSNAYFEFTVRGTQTVTIGDAFNSSSVDVFVYELDDIQLGKLGVRFFLLGEEEHDLSGMAKVTRDYLITNMGMKANLPETAPLYLSVLGSIQVTDSVMGIPMDVIEPTTTLKQAAAMVSELQGLGVQNIRMLYDNWSKSQLDEKIVSKLDLTGKLGSVKDLNALKDLLGKDGGSLSLVTNSLIFGQGGNGVSKGSSSVRNINGMPVARSYYSRHLFFSMTEDYLRLLTAPLATDYFKGLADSVAKKAEGVQLMLGDYGNTLYTDFTENGYRRFDMAEAIAQSLSGVSVGLVGDNPNFYALPYLSDAVNIPTSTTEYDIVDETVNFYQMVLHGLIPYGGRAINRYGNPTQEYLRCIASGTTPNYELLYENSSRLKENEEIDSYYGGNYASWKTTIAEDYLKYAALYEKSYSAYIEEIQEVQSGLVRTVYSNGVCSLVNFNSQDVQWDGKTVPATDFIWMEGVA